MIRRPPRSTHVPDTTLFRSYGEGGATMRSTPAPVPGQPPISRTGRVLRLLPVAMVTLSLLILVLQPLIASAQTSSGRRVLRSEEHTSELQSRQYLVCRLLLDNDTATTEIYTRSRHDALPILR